MNNTIEMMEDDKDSDLKRALTVCIKVGKLLLENGAETFLIRELVERTGKILKMDSTEIFLSSSSMVLTVAKNGKWFTISAKCPERGINMKVVMLVQMAIVSRERGYIASSEMVDKILNMNDKRYNPWLVAIVVALSCGCFSRLAGGDWATFGVASIASFAGMVVLHQFKSRAFNPLVSVFMSAFTATLITGYAVVKGIGQSETIAIYSAVLMLVPGYPLVNAVSDLIKGFKNMGLARWTFASLLTLAISLGMTLAMNVLGM